MSFEDRYHRPTETSREIFREFRFTIIKLGIYSYRTQIMREDTHRFCLKYAPPTLQITI
jgi:hypothetical protein